jgi:PAS domain-containing protein
MVPTNELELLFIKAQQEIQLIDGKHQLLGFFEYAPIPMWVKHWPTLKMIVTNEAYAERYGIERVDYTGNVDGEIWAQETADAYAHNDTDAALKGGFYGTETITNGRTGKREELTVYKWPITIDGEVVGIAGMVTDWRELCDG